MIYVYEGPTSGVTLGNGAEVMLFDGQEVELPEADDYTKTLVALGHLTAVDVKPQKVAKNGKEAANAS